VYTTQVEEEVGRKRFLDLGLPEDQIVQQLLIDKIYDNFFHQVQGGQPVIFLGNGSKTQNLSPRGHPRRILEGYKML